MKAGDPGSNICPQAGCPAKISRVRRNVLPHFDMNIDLSLVLLRPLVSTGILSRKTSQSHTSQFDDDDDDDERDLQKLSKLKPLPRVCQPPAGN
jgi:hypothetical protein